MSGDMIENIVENCSQVGKTSTMYLVCTNKSDL